MIKINKHIEIVRSTNSRLSSLSRSSAATILTVLSDHYTTVSITTVNNVSDLRALAAYPPDLVFLGMKFVPAGQTKIWLTDYLDAQGIAYTGSDRQAHELELNKSLAKQRAMDNGLATSKFYVVRQQQLPDRENASLSFPVFVKPTDRGGGLGIDSNSVAHNFDELCAKVQAIAQKLKSDALVEEYLPGREFSVAILRDRYSSELLALPIELIAEPNQRGARLLSGQVKSANAEQITEIIDPTLKSAVITLAVNIFEALGARDYGRIDIRLDADGTPHFLEANLLPSLIDGYGSFPKACLLNMNLDYEAMILRIAELGLAHTEDSRDTETVLESVAISHFPDLLSYRQP